MMQLLFPAFFELMPITLAQEFSACVAACACICYAVHLVRKAVR